MLEKVSEYFNNRRQKRIERARAENPEEVSEIERITEKDSSLSQEESQELILDTDPRKILTLSVPVMGSALSAGFGFMLATFPYLLFNDRTFGSKQAFGISLAAISAASTIYAAKRICDYWRRTRDFSQISNRPDYEEIK